MPPEQLAGTFVGNGCLLSPPCLRMEIMPGERSCAPTALARIPVVRSFHADQLICLRDSLLRWYLRAQVLRKLPDSVHVPIHDELLR